MNPELLDLDLPCGTVPTPPDRPLSPEETERWQTENRRLRILSGNPASGFEPTDRPFTMEAWPLGEG